MKVDELPFRDLLDAAPDGMVVCDRSGAILLVNAEACRMFGYTRDELVGRKVDTLVPAAVRPHHHTHVASFTSSPRLRPMGSGRDLHGARKDGTEFAIEISLSPIQTSQGLLVTAGIRDITERRKLEAEARRARATAEAASAAKSEFLSSMSHELRTPLNAILGFAQLLERDRKNPLDPRQLERLQYVLRGGEHLLRLIDDVLDLSKIEAGGITISTETVAIAPLINEVIHTLEPMATRAQIRLSSDAGSDSVPYVRADRTRLAQVLMNFGSNAIKYGREGGFLGFRVEHLDKVVRITASDNGIGIPESKRAKLFEPFQRAGQEAGPIQGTGIGLSISKRLAELMHGGVGFESTEGQGSEFWIEVPVDPSPRATPTRPNKPPSSALLVEPTREHLVVYVEDNPSNIAFMRDVMEEIPTVELVTARTAEIGIELIRTRKPRIVIMDINLPGMSGLEAVALLRTFPETKDIPVIGLSAAALVKDTAGARSDGFYRYLTKPVKVAELTALVEELVDGAHPT